eukprot:CAMPEP_0119142814 /NCGR_PEP_ID=MMETSP1310-20130426/33336_1 /TAXON_ID=464262 /ORGANISM="Genus nov. species nov., Strain RCC2339" /LENGTH=228 /DNA_ID=CAMNT_0007134387 /DNA_START=129 /DNA_END=815 /DNA_ORIENTATION=-
MITLRIAAPFALSLALFFLAVPARSEIINGHNWTLNLEYRLLTEDDPPFSRQVYVCNTDLAGNCENSTSWDALTPQSGWEVAPARVRLFDSATVVLPAPPAGLPAQLVLGGYTLDYTAEVLDGKIFAFPPPWAVATVMRDTAMTYDVGTVVHEVTGPDGFRYTLFTAEVIVAQTYDLTMEGTLSGLSYPSGWIYSSRTLTEALVLDSDGLAYVLSAPTTSWQRWNTKP